jgi:hypothetical protein
MDQGKGDSPGEMVAGFVKRNRVASTIPAPCALPDVDVMWGSFDTAIGEQWNPRRVGDDVDSTVCVVGSTAFGSRSAAAFWSAGQFGRRAQQALDDRVHRPRCDHIRGAIGSSTLRERLGPAALRKQA